MACGGVATAAPIEEIYELFPPLRERHGQPASRLSGGERQMLSIGRALMARAKASFCSTSRRWDWRHGWSLRSWRWSARLADGFGLAVLLVEQNARSALSVADRGVVLNLGHVVADQPAEQLAADERLRHAYLGF